MITAEELVLEVDNAEESSNFKLGTVMDLFEIETAKIQFDGEETPSEKQYAYLSSYTPTIGDRVLLGVLGGTYIILGKVNYNVGPDVEEEIDRYLFDLKQVVMKLGLNVTGNSDIDGNANITGNIAVTGEADISGQLTAGGVNSTGDVTAAGKVSGNSISGTNITATGSIKSGSSYMENEKIYSPTVEGNTVRCSKLLHTGLWLSFFNGTQSQKKSVFNLGTSATLEDVRDKVNQLLQALDGYGLINN